MIAFLRQCQDWITLQLIDYGDVGWLSTRSGMYRKHATERKILSYFCQTQSIPITQLRSHNLYNGSVSMQASVSFMLYLSLPSSLWLHCSIHFCAVATSLFSSVTECIIYGSNPQEYNGEDPYIACTYVTDNHMTLYHCALAHIHPIACMQKSTCHISCHIIYSAVIPQ